MTNDKRFFQGLTLFTNVCHSIEPLHLFAEIQG